MNPALHAFLEWLLRTSSQAAIITLLVLLAQICLCKNLDARWRHLLWLLVLARLALPVSIPSPTSLFNYVRVEAADTSTVAVPLPIRLPSPSPSSSLAVAEREVPMNSEPSIAPSVQVTPIAVTQAWPVKSRGTSLNWR